MSETEIIEGKLVKIDLEGKTKFEDIMELCKSKGIEIEDIDFEEKYFYSDFLFEVGGEYFQLVDRVDHEIGDDILNVTKNEDGSYDFLVSYYSGGCSFSEAIKTALENLKE